MPARKKDQRELLEEKWQNDVEDLDTTPAEATVPIVANPLSIQEELKRFVRQELSQAADQAEADTFEEANDFDEEDPDTLDLTAYELHALEADLTPPLDGEDPQDADLPVGGVGETPTDNQTPSDGAVEPSESDPTEAARSATRASEGPTGDN